ncbi:MAG: hypothetical protein ACOC4J_05650 [Bacteroidota bacterium]
MNVLILNFANPKCLRPDFSNAKERKADKNKPVTNEFQNCVSVQSIVVGCLSVLNERFDLEKRDF